MRDLRQPTVYPLLALAALAFTRRLECCLDPAVVSAMPPRAHGAMSGQLGQLGQLGQWGGSHRASRFHA